jgi:serine/threonine-protein kinase RsbW
MCNNYTRSSGIVPCRRKTSELEASEQEVSLSRSEEVAPLLAGIVSALAKLGYSQRDRMGLELALEEAIVNSLRHGNGGDPSKQVRVHYRVTHQAVLIDVEDEGPGFDPNRVPDPTLPENRERPSGRGLLLMGHYTDWMRFSARGNRVTLYKCRSA